MREGDLSLRSMLIKPHATWSMREWRINSAMIHGISPAELRAHGVDVIDVYKALVADLTGYIVVSDNEEFDQRWLNRLCEVAGRPVPFQIEELSVVIPGLTARTGVSIDQAVSRFLIAMVSSPHLVRHRAGADAERLLKLILDSVVAP